VKILRDFRDKFLFTNHIGQSFVNWYYKVSPPLADFIRDRDIMKTIVRMLLLPAVGFAYNLLDGWGASDAFSASLLRNFYLFGDKKILSI
jgi:hypothetical protein